MEGKGKGNEGVGEVLPGDRWLIIDFFFCDLVFYKLIFFSIHAFFISLFYFCFIFVFVRPGKVLSR